MKLTGTHNQCGGCRRYFNSNYAFTKHRIGEHGVDRRCMTDEEMLRRGMFINATGWWVGQAMKEWKNEDDSTEASKEVVE